MKSLIVVFLVLVLETICSAQDGSYVRYSERYSTNPPRLYSGGTYIGELSTNRYAPDSVSNKYGKYGSRYSPSSINNPHSQYGRYRTQPIYVYEPYVYQPYIYQPR